MMLTGNNALFWLICGSGLTISSCAFGHGSLVNPPSRHVSCIQQGTLTGICKEASEKSNDGGQSIYTWQELTGFVGGSHSAEEAKKAIPGHLLCSGTTRGSGFNMASASWKTTLLKPDASGKVTMRYGYTQPHTPSWIEFYISKKGVDPTKKVIGWEDVDRLGDVVSSTAPVRTSGQKPAYTSYEEFSLEIPADRTGRAVIFARWQRNDAGNEGFYSCSDVMITERGSEIIPPPPPEEGNEDDPAPVDWFEYSKFAATQTAKAGDTVIFRLMGEARGSDLVNIRKPVTASNAGESWIGELAADINKNYSNLVQIGQQSQGGVITFNPQQPRNNGIFLNNRGYSAVLTVEAPSGTPLAVVPASFTVESTSEASAAYPLDGSASQNALSYRWKVVGGQGTFWLQEHQGGGWLQTVNQSVARALIPANTTGTAIYELTVTGKDGQTHANRVSVTVKKKETGSGEYPAWQQGKTYLAGDKVTFEGIKYIASYWTQAQPGSHDSWKLADNSQVAEWKAAMTYVAGNIVTWQGKKYMAKQWTTGNQPDQSPGIWKEN